MNPLTSKLADKPATNIIRLIVKTIDGANAVHIGGDVDVYYKTFKINCPELKAYLSEPISYGSRLIVGAEHE